MQKKPVKNRRFCGVTLIELLVVFFIVGIMLSFALPSYYKTAERSRAKRAAFNLQAIYNAEKRYKLAHGSYYACNPCLSQIKNELGVDLTDNYFDYTIEAGTDFRAIATRRGGLCAGKTMSVTQDGSQIAKECDLW